jgi:hypothetical protein
MFNLEILHCVTNYIKHSQSLDGNMQFAELLKKLAAFNGNLGSSLRSQELATGPNPDTDASSPHCSILFL